jgi:cupin 2 domain-containing protein
MTMPPEIRNLFDAHPDSGEELVLPVLRGVDFRMEHIVSNGAASPANYWYDQESAEWVALVQGSATLEFEDGAVQLVAGDSLVIPAHLKHRVAQTSADAVWLAIHFRADQ